MYNCTLFGDVVKWKEVHFLPALPDLLVAKGYPRLARRSFTLSATVDAHARARPFSPKAISTAAKWQSPQELIPSRSSGTRNVPLPFRQCPFLRRTLLVPFTLNHSANTCLVPLPSRQCSFLRRTLFVPFTPNHSANTCLVPLPSRQCSFLRRTLFVPFTLNHSANTSPCHCRFGSALSHDVPCSFPSR